MEDTNKAVGPLNRAITRRQALKVGGLAAVGLVFSKPIIDTIKPRPAFAANYVPREEPPPPPDTPPQPLCVFLIIDEDSLDNGIHFNSSGGAIIPSGPQFFSQNDVNDDKPGEKQRDVLRYFANNVGKTITVTTGRTNDEGWFAPNCIPQKWISGSSNTCLTGIPMQTAIANYVGANGSGNIPEQDKLDKIPDVRPLRALGLVELIGKDVCAVVYDSDVSINYDHGTPLGVNGNLQGETLGVVAFHVNDVRKLNGFSDSTLPEVQITILDAATCCAGPFHLHDAPIPDTSSVPNDVDPLNPPSSGYRNRSLVASI